MTDRRLDDLAGQASSAEALIGSLGAQLLNLKAVLAEMKNILVEMAEDRDETTPS